VSKLVGPAARAAVLLISLAFSLPRAAFAAQATQDTAVTQDSALEAKVRDVASALRCPVCQNLSILDSPSQLARDMKKVVREKLAAGESPDEVRRYFVSRYGEWVLLKPKASGVNLSVWLLPLLALLGGAAVVWTAVRRWVRQGATAMGTPPPTEESSSDLRARRAGLKASIEELDAELAAGRLTATDHAFLKQRDEAELAVVNEDMKRLRKAQPGSAPVGAQTSPAQADAPRATAKRFRVPPALGWGAGLAAFAVVAALSLKESVVAREPGGSITGEQAGAAAPPGGPFGKAGPLDSLRITQLEARVRRDSSDVPALVELGHLYLIQGRFKSSADVSMKAVQLEPDAEESAEAFAHLGMILFSTGEIDGAMKSVDKALFLHPDLPEALLYKGIVLFAGERNMSAAAVTLQRYLEVAPADANTARVQGMLQAAREADSAGTTGRR